MEKLKILIAEDTKTMRKVYELGLEEDKFSITFAEDGQQAIDNFEQNSYDIILLDIELPLLSGYMVLKTIRQSVRVVKKGAEHSGERKPLVVMATAVGKKEDILDCIKLGINGYLVKPIDVETISDKLMDIYHGVYPA